MGERGKVKWYKGKAMGGWEDGEERVGSRRFRRPSTWVVSGVDFGPSRLV